MLQTIAILHDTANYRATRLLGATQSLLLKGRDTTGLVAWRWILTTWLAMREEVVLEVVDERYSLAKELLIAATLHKDGFSAEHLRNLGKDGSAALLLAKEVRECTQEWVGSDAGEAVRTTALEADAKLACWNGLALVLLSLLYELGEEINTVRNFVALHFLADHELHTILVVVTAELLEDTWLVVFATEAYYEDGTSIWMVNHVAEDLLGVLVVFAQL